MRAARRFAEEREAEARLLIRSASPGVPGVTLDAWWQRWFAAQDLAPSTLASYAQQYRRHIRPRWGDRLLQEISSLQVAGFTRDLRESGLASSSVNVVLAVLRDLLVDAAAEHLIPGPPVFRTGRRCRRVPDDRRAGVAVDLATVAAICDRLPADAGLLVWVAVFTGMRRGEVSAMRRSLLTFEPRSRSGVPGSGRYVIDPLVGAVHEDVHRRRCFGPPKGGRGRVIDLPPFLVDLLARRVAALGEGELLFPDTRGRPRRHTDWLRVWRAACDGRPAQYFPDGRIRRPAVASIHPGLRMQDLRHTHESMLIELGVPEVLQNERLGHHPAGAAGIYAHATPAMREHMLTALQQLWEQHQDRHSPTDGPAVRPGTSRGGSGTAAP